DALVGDAPLGDLNLAQGQGQYAGPLLDGRDETAVPGDGPELRRVLVPLGTRNEECLVRGRNVPEQHDDLPFPALRRGSNGKGGLDRAWGDQHGPCRQRIDDDYPGMPGNWLVGPRGERLAAPA